MHILIKKVMSYKTLIISVFLSLISSIALSINFYSDSFINFSYKFLIRFIVLLLFYLLIIPKCFTIEKELIVSSIIISFLCLIASGFHYLGGIYSLFSSFYMFIKSCIFIIGFLPLMLTFQKSLYITLETHGMCFINNAKKYNYFFIIWALFLIAWLPFLIISFPGIVSPDAFNHLYEVCGTNLLTAHNPPLATFTFKLFIDIGLALFNNANIGLFLIVISQYLFSSAVFAYLFSTLILLKAPKPLFYISLFSFCFMPHVFESIVIVNKDIFYSVCFSLLIIETIYEIIDTKQFFSSIRHIILYAISLFGIIGYRHNGIYIVAVYLLLLFFFFIFHNIKEYDVLKLGVLLLPMLVPIVIYSYLMNHYDIIPASKCEVLCAPFQQIARMSKTHPEWISDDDVEVIDKILDYDQISSLYNPIIADPVKGTYKYDSTNEDAIQFIKTWLVLSIKHPSNFFNTLIHQNYLLMYPMFNNDINYYYEYNISYENDDYSFTLSTPKSLSSLKNTMIKYKEFIYNLPFVSLLSNIAIANIVLVTLILFSIRHKVLKISIILLAPLVMTVCLIILGPCIFFNPRYGLPILYSLPSCISFCNYLFNNRNSIPQLHS